ncbi:hypothetical protein GCM10008929_17390 [Alkalibacterium psychrotolerans]
MTNLNTKATVDRAKNVLKEYRKAKRLAPDEIDFKYKRRSEIGSLGLYALEQLTYLDEAISSLKEEQKEIIMKRYVQIEEISDIEIYYSLGYSESAYYRQLKKALVKFAEAYKAGELLVFKEE